jgi:hypothetical protein
MKKFLSIFVALAMVLSLFAGVGARSAKAATFSSASGNLAGGAAAVTAVAATTSLTLGGTPTVGDTVYASYQVIGSSAPVDKTYVATTASLADLTTGFADTFTGVTGVTAAAASPATGVITLTQSTAGTAGNGRTLTVAKLGTVNVTSAGNFAGGVDGAAIVAAKVDITLGGTVTTGSIVSLKVNATTVTHTVVGSDTAITIATALQVAANANATIVASVAATDALGVLTLTAQTAGVAGNAITYAISDSANTALSITSTLPAGTVGAAYMTTLAAAGGSGTYAWSLVAGTVLPAGLGFTSGGVLSGTPTVAGTYTIPVTVTDGALTTTSALSITIAATGTTVVGTPTALTVTSSGTFTGGVDGVGAAAVDALGTVVSSTLNSAVVNVTTAGVGIFDATTPNVSVTKKTPLTATSADADWATLGNQYITFSDTGTLVGDELTVTASGAAGVGTVLMVSGTTDLVNVTTANVGTLTGFGVVTAMRPTSAGFTTLSSTDVDWMTVGATQSITFTGMATLLAVGDGLEVTMDQLQPAVAAYGFLTLTGATSGSPISAGTVATATWQDTTGASHTASYTVLAGGENLAAVTTKLIAAINATAGGLVTATLYGTSSIKLTQTVEGAVGNGKTLTSTTSATGTSLTICTLGGLTQPAYVEVGKTIQLVAVDPTGAIVAATWAPVTSTAATIDANGLLRAMTDSGVTLVTATSGTFTGTFVVVNVPTQTITSLVVTLVPATLKVAGKQQFGAIAASAGYSALDYTTQAAWTDTLPVGVISNAAPTQGLLTYSTAETGDITAIAAGLTSTATAIIDATGVVTVKAVPVTVTKVIVLTVGTDIVTVDGKATSVDAAPELVAGRTFVPIRFIAETFGSTVTWLPETKGVTIVLGTTTIGLQIGNKTVVINSNVIALEAAPYIKNSRTMVPLRVISESFGGDVVWDAALRTITITYVVPVAVPVV